MSGSDQVKAEMAALRALRGAVTSYSGQLREAMANARRDADALVKRAEDAARKRKAGLDRAVADQKQVEAALARCRDEQQAAALGGELAATRRLVGERKQLLGYAQQAVKAVTDARSDLLKVIQAQEPVVGENSSVAAHALADIEGKLHAISPESFASRAAHGVKGLMVGGAFLADTVVGAGHVGHFAQTLVNGYESVDGHPATSQELRAEQLSDNVENLAVSDQKNREAANDDLERK